MSGGGQAHIVPWLVLGEARRGQLLERLDTIVHDWHGTWSSAGAAEPAAVLSAEPGVLEARGGAVTLVARHESLVLLHATASADVARMLVGVGAPDGALAAVITRPDGLTLSLAEGAVRALCGKLVQAAFADMSCTVERQRTVPAVGARRNRGVAATVTLGKSRIALEMLLAPELVDALLGDRPAVTGPEPLVSRRRASSEERVQLSALLGAASVSWRDLTTLAAGDVLVLEQSLESPCALVAGGSGKVAEAQLGSRAGSLAVQITRITPETKASRDLP
jgi:hypothetical protein